MFLTYKVGLEAQFILMMEVVDKQVNSFIININYKYSIWYVF